MAQKGHPLATLLPLVLVIGCMIAYPVAAHGLQPGQLQEFFRLLDANANGQLEKAEVQRYIQQIGGTEFDTQQEVDTAAQQTIGKVDSSDVGSTISESEFDVYLHKVLQVRSQCIPYILHTYLSCRPLHDSDVC